MVVLTNEHTTVRIVQQQIHRATQKLREFGCMRTYITQLVITVERGSASATRASSSVQFVHGLLAELHRPDLAPSFRFIVRRRRRNGNVHGGNTVGDIRKDLAVEFRTFGIMLLVSIQQNRKFTYISGKQSRPCPTLTRIP
jgi:hypothetical protein